MKKCGDCVHWNKPSIVYEEKSIGSCKLFDAWMLKHSSQGRPPSTPALNRVMTELGAVQHVSDYRHVFMRDTLRYCKRFVLS
jgi:hypothetical protein